MAYQITAEHARSVDDVESAFGTKRFLPAWEEIPEEFKTGNLYTRVVEALFNGTPVPECEIELHNDLEPTALRRCISAHLQCWAPKHEHKIAGVGFMLSKLTTLHPPEQKPTG